MWTVENRARYDRGKLRYPSDLTDDEGSWVEPLIPPAKRGGNKRTVDIREVMNGVMYGLGTGGQWAALPKDLPPRSTVDDYVLRWQHDRTLERLHHVLYVQCRELGVSRSEIAWAGREASPAVGIVTRKRVPDIDSQSVKGAETGGACSIRTGLTRARRSRARSATSLSTHTAC